ncbi:MAG: nucleotide sugar dehydrogenase [Desulfosporosinus sp.]
MNVYVIGLGHVGLPMACFAALAGKKVTGIDSNPVLIEQIKNGTVNIFEYLNGRHIAHIAKDLIAQGTMQISTRFKRKDMAPAVFLVSVGIKSALDFKQDLTPLQDVINTLFPCLVNGDLIIFRTTLIPGTLDSLVVPALKSLNTKILLAYCPETISETAAFSELATNPIVIAGLDDESFEATAAFFSSISQAPIHRASTFKTAELVKVVQNVARDVNIALVNELSEAASAMEVDIYEVIWLANTHPRVELLKPGPGVGGYCLPNALVYLASALKNQQTLTLTSTARQCNLARPKKVVQFVADKLEEKGIMITNAQVAVVGLAMKDNCADCRYSPAVDIVNSFVAKGAKVKVFDPIVDQIFPFQVNSLSECLSGADCLLITASQPGLDFDFSQMEKLMACQLIIDTRNVLPKTAGDGWEIYRF